MSLVMYVSFCWGFFLHYIWHDSRKDESYDSSWVVLACWLVGGDGHPILDGPWLKICHLRGINQTLLKHGMKNHTYYLGCSNESHESVWTNSKFFAATHVSFGKSHCGVTLLKFFWPCLSLVCCLVIWFVLFYGTLWYLDLNHVEFVFSELFPNGGNGATQDAFSDFNHFTQVNLDSSFWVVVYLEFPLFSEFFQGDARFSIILVKQSFVFCNKLYLDTRWESAKLNLSKKVAQGGCVPDIP